ncbi:MAG: hybrid sensor histidine kinase/response regulator [Verrucomicrobiota bacterium]
MKPDTSQATIMIVDDEPENLNVLETVLSLAGYRVAAFPRGAMALAAARDEMPDLILLDVNMPEMDGYEVCRRCKADERLQHIPIVFLSALTDISDKARAFEVGAVDYVPKPFAQAEVVARVGTHVKLRRYQHHLEELVEQRLAELTEAHRRLQLWDGANKLWLNVLSHEMRTPLNGVIGSAELLFGDLAADSPLHALRADYDEACARIDKLMNDALALVAIEVKPADIAVAPISLALALSKALDAGAGQIPAIEPRAALAAVEGVTVVADAALLDRAFGDLLLTATQCVKTGEPIVLETRVVDGQAQVIIATGGGMLSAEALEMFFEVGGQRTLLKGGGDFGLGAALASRILHLFNGHVAVHNGEHRGLVMEISLPVHAAPPPASLDFPDYSGAP